uniref:Uncharacterized protein n=1 Tax=Timema monikensis TaxID=170555 RepID=A0A7R9ECC7_9NEOP|nr:unnamed protein product [Timema monikensis]
MRLSKSPGFSEKKHFLLASVILFAQLFQNASLQGLSIEDVEIVPLDVEPGALGEDGGVDVFGNLSSGDGEGRRGEIRMGVDLEETVEEVPGSRPKEDVEQVGVPETPDIAVNPESVEPKIESKTQNFEIYDYSNYDRAGSMQLKIRSAVDEETVQNDSDNSSSTPQDHSSSTSSTTSTTSTTAPNSAVTETPAQPEIEVMTISYMAFILTEQTPSVGEDGVNFRG